MSFFDKLFRSAVPTEAIMTRELTTREGRGVPGVPASTNEQAQTVKTGGGTFSERISFVRSPQAALAESAVYRATELRANTIGVMPVQYQMRSPKGKNFVTDMAGAGRRLNYLLQEEPNPLTTASSLWKMVTINRLMTGNGFVYIERDDMGFPVHLWLVTNGGYNYAKGVYSFSYLTEEGMVAKTNVPKSDMLHFPNTFRYQNGFWGVSTLQYAIQTLSLIRTQKQQTLETAAKGGRVKLIIGEDTTRVQSPISAGMFDPKQMQDYAMELQSKMYSGQDVLAIRGLDKVQNISMTAQDMQMMESLGIGYDDVARFWATPRPLLMLDTNSHYNDYQNATMEYHTRTILPDKTDMEQEIARKLIGFRDYGFRRIHMCEKPLLAMDPERQAKVDQLNLQTGAKSVNEIRSEHDMPSVENGDIIYVSTNLAELGSKKLSGESSTELKPGNYTVKEPEKNDEPAADKK